MRRRRMRGRQIRGEDYKQTGSGNNGGRFIRFLLTVAIPGIIHDLSSNNSKIKKVTSKLFGRKQLEEHESRQQIKADYKVIKGDQDEK